MSRVETLEAERTLASASWERIQILTNLAPIITISQHLAVNATQMLLREKKKLTC